MNDKERFLANYRGTLNAEQAYNDYKKTQDIKEKWKDATYDKNYNDRMARQEINQLKLKP